MALRRSERVSALAAEAAGPTEQIPAKRKPVDQGKTRSKKRRNDTAGFEFVRVRKPSVEGPGPDEGQRTDKKEKGRRSSLSLRGKRASSMSMNSKAQPHTDLPTEHFYRHISADLPEPVRMKQLLAWTARRVMDREKATSTRQPVEANAAAIARVIEEDVLKDLSENQVPLSWYSRTEDVVPVGKKKHPQNLANLAKIQECNEILEKLRREEDSWHSLLRSGAVADAGDEAEGSSLSMPGMDAELGAQPSELLPTVELEFQIDRMHQTLHSLESFANVSDRFAGALLASVSARLDTHGSPEAAEQDALRDDDRDVLRALTRTATRH